MKFLNLHLPAFGPFTEFQLDFADSPGLQVIYGPNESGKSSSLRAFKALLYGMGRQTTDDFLHPYKQLRIGAKLQHSDGRILEINRRKGSKDTLQNNQGELVDEGVLNAFMGHLSEEVFDRLYGLDHRTLSSGGRALLEEGGKVGESLFAANVGPIFRQVRQELRSEADELWRPRGRNQAINSALSDWKAARQRSKELTLQPSNYQTLLKDLEQDQELSRQTQEQYTQARLRLRTLENQKAALPSWLKLRDLQEQLATFAELPDLDDEFSTRRESARTDLEKARAELRRLGEERARIEDQLEKTPREWPLLAIQDSVELLYQRSSQINEIEAKLPKVEASLQDLKERLKRSYQHLGDEAGLSLQSFPDAAAQAEARQLSAQSQTLTQEEEHLSQARTKLEAKQKQQRDELESLGETLDIAELELLLSQARRGAASQQRLEELEHQLKGQVAIVKTALAKLPFWTGRVDDLKAIPVPSQELVVEYARKLGEAHKLLDSAKKELGRVQTQEKRLQTELEALEMTGSVPSPEKLAELREARQQNFLRLLAAWKAGEAPQESLLLSYSDSVRRADELSDLIAQSADGLARRAQLLGNLGKVRREAAEIAERVESAGNDVSTLEKEWLSLWPADKITPRPPQEMERWLSNREAVLAEARSYDRLRAECEKLKSEGEQLLHGLGQALSKAFSHTPSSLGTLSEALDYVEKKVASAKELSSRRKSLGQALSGLELELEDLKAGRRRLQEKRELWQSRWQAVVSQFFPQGDPSPQALEARLKDYEALQQLLRDRDALSQQWVQLKSEKEQFDKQAQSILELLPSSAPELSKLPSVTLVQSLYSQLQQSREEKKNRLDLEKRQGELEASQSENQYALKRAQEQIGALLAEAGVGELELLPDLEKKVRSKREIEKSVDHLSDALLELSGGESLPAFCATLSQLSPFDLERELEELSDQVKLLQSQSHEQMKRVGELQERLQRLDGSALAAEAAEEAAHSMARGVDSVRRYLCLELAEHILKVEIENYRLANERPILKRSSHYFSQLTCGAYGELQSGFDEKSGEPVLEAIAPNGRLVTIDGMSEGTRDQLFLSLRLATIDQRTKHAEPFPFIADDILVQFDEERARATLEVLAEFAQTQQVLLFTHLSRDKRLAEEMERQKVTVQSLQRLRL